MALSLEHIAEELWQAEHSGTPCAPLREKITQAAQSANAADVLNAAYAVQSINIKRKMAGGERLVGARSASPRWRCKSSSASILLTSACCWPACASAMAKKSRRRA